MMYIREEGQKEEPLIRLHMRKVWQDSPRKSRLMIQRLKEEPNDTPHSPPLQQSTIPLFTSTAIKSTPDKPHLPSLDPNVLTRTECQTHES